MKKFGIDVSRWQGDFDFGKAKNEGVQFAIIRCGGADGLDGFYKDPMLDRNYKYAKDAGIDVGFYFFGNAKTVTDAISEARYCHSLIKGKKFEYPIFYDVESENMIVGKDLLTEIVKAFCNEMENLGYWCGFYTNYDWYLYKLNGPVLAERYSFWFAFWGSTMAEVPNVQMWQFGGSENFIRQNTVAGVVCDQDYCFVDYPKLIKSKGKNGYSASSSSSSTKPNPSTPKQDNTKLKVGDKIKIKSDALIYGFNEKFLDFVYKNTYYIIAINGEGNNRIVFGPEKGNTGLVTGAVDKKYVIKCD